MPWLIGLPRRSEGHGATTKFFVWAHWGRNGENGQNKLEGAFGEAEAIKGFEAKFKAKTSNQWADRDNFVPKSGKYDLVDVDEVRPPVSFEPLLCPSPQSQTALSVHPNVPCKHTTCGNKTALTWRDGCRTQRTRRASLQRRARAR